MIIDEIHLQVLKKFHALEGETLIGKAPVKGIKKGVLVPSDKYVDYDHMMHSLVRGFYKPAQKPYLLSYQATESEGNYGKQIRWLNKKEYNFEVIEMQPPNSPTDNRVKSDINAARYNMEHRIPIGILLNERKSVNIVLGLGFITKETKDGVFLVRPYKLVLQELISSAHDFFNENEETKDKVTDVLRKVTQRYGQDIFRSKLQKKFNSCVLCKVSNEYAIASHIKPWSESTDKERLDVNNGLLLCPNHDYLFDGGIITFDEKGQILISSKISSSQIIQFGINQSMRIELSDFSRKYMAYHRDNRFKK